MLAFVKERLLEQHLAWTPRRYAAWRALLGAVLCVQMLELLPRAMELWSSLGVLRDAPAGSFGLFSIADGAVFVTLVTGAAAVLAMMVALGRGDRTAAVLLWAILASMAARNPLALDAGASFFGWLLLAHALVPPVRDAQAEPVTEPPAVWSRLFPQLPFRGRPAVTYWHFPALLWAAAWILVAATYAADAGLKLQSPAWTSGTALAELLQSPVARDGALRELLLALPSWMLAGATWMILLLELAFAPLALLRAARPWLWLAMVLMQVSLLALADSAGVQMAMLMLHLLTLNPEWITVRLPHRRPVQAWRDAHA